MPNSQFYHTELLPANLNLLQAQEVLSNHFSGQVLIGVDEAGRGPMAGPVVAGAVILKGNGIPHLLNDSKKLSEKQREKIFEELPNYCSAYSIGEASAQEIDEIGILNATFLAMRRAIEILFSKYTPSGDFVPATPLQEGKEIPINGNMKILVDGNLYIREIDQDLQMPIIKGDGRVACIAAASIFAKVHRDNLMREYAKEFPQYSFEKHKGYGTKAHLEAIEKFGLCEIHRKSFRIR